MPDLKTNYLGLELRNPIVAGSSGLTKSVEGIKRCADAGAGAVVLKSLFEEEIRLQFSDTQNALGASHSHPDAYEYFQADLATHLGPKKYLELIENASKAVDIPVIASVNCVTGDTWASYAGQIEAAGAKALELNVYALPMDPRLTSDELESVYVDAVRAVKEKVSIPVSLKLVPHITNTMRLARRLGDVKVDGMVLFNRFFEPDINIESLEYAGGLSLSEPAEFRHSLRWIALLYGRTQANLCASTGIYSGETVVKQILAGASAVQVVSALYRNGISEVEGMLSVLENWMKRHKFASINDFKGKMSKALSDDAHLLERAQHIKAFVNAE